MEEHKSINTCIFSDKINIGDYVIIQRQDFFKIHQLSLKSPIKLGTATIELDRIVGHPYWTTFQMMPSGKKQHYTLQINKKFEELTQENTLKNYTSGIDNRNICDDGSSQVLSTEEISELRESGLSSLAIVGKLIKNSKTFENKTGYSQAKYLKKKEKKYFEYITIRKPSLPLIAQILYKRDEMKLMGMSIATLSQITSAVNIQPDGLYVLFESGTQGLVGAAVLNYLCESGRLIHMSHGDPQKQAILAMNFSTNQLSSYISTRVATLLEHLKEPGVALVEKTTILHSLKTNTNSCTSLQTDVAHKMKTAEDEVTSSVVEENIITEMNGDTDNTNLGLAEESTAMFNSYMGEKQYDLTKVNHNINSECDSIGEAVNEISSNKLQQSTKRKASCDQGPDEYKKPRWAKDVEVASQLMISKKADGLIIVSKEHPSNILAKLLPYVGLSRPFVVYSMFREVLAELFVELKKRNDVTMLRVSETWLRTYQVLPDRTHPDVLMSGSGGFLLSGIVVGEN